MKDKTSIIISHRISAVKDSDFIAVFDQGRLFSMESMKGWLRKMVYIKIYTINSCWRKNIWRTSRSRRWGIMETNYNEEENLVKEYDSRLMKRLLRFAKPFKLSIVFVMILMLFLRFWSFKTLPYKDCHWRLYRRLQKPIYNITKILKEV